MRKAIKITAAILLINCLLLVHELGHAVEMWRQGVEIETIAIGIDLGILPEFSTDITVSQKKITLKVSPLPLGAYVKMSDKGMATKKTLNLRKQARIFGMGVAVNIVLGAVLLIVPILITRRLPRGREAYQLAVILTVSVLIFAAPDLFFVWLIPAIGTVILVRIAQQGLRRIFGPVGVVRMITRNIKTPVDAIYMTAFISLGLATVNMFPLCPMDGSQIILTTLTEYSEIAGRIFFTTTGTIAIVTLSTIIFKDFAGINR